MAIDLSEKTIVPLFLQIIKKGKNSTSMKNLEMPRTILNCFEFSAIFFQTSFPICEYQI